MLNNKGDGELKNDKLRNARLKRRLTQSQVAGAVGIAEVSYQRIEYGTQNPSLKTAIRIARVLGVPVEELWIYKS